MSKAQIIKPDSEVQEQMHKVSIFLAGSISNGLAGPWADELQNELKDYNITIYNPRRNDWNGSLIQRKSNPEFNYQVNWELDHIESVDILYMYFESESQSPITLAELGVIYKKNRIVLVCCPEGFWRIGNVEVMTERSNYPLYYSFTESITALRKEIEKLIK